MPNLSPDSRQDNDLSATPAGYLRGEVRELAWGMAVTLKILDGYAELGQDEMIIFTTRHLIAAVKVLREIARRLHELKRQEISDVQGRADRQAGARGPGRA